MGNRYFRRQLLRAGATAGAAGLAGPLATGTSSEPAPSSEQSQSSDPPVDIRGANYIPARAFNTYQMWRDYDPDIAERDLSYAARVNLNAIRVWLNYEFWLEGPSAHEQAVEHFLSAAADQDIRVLVGLFEGIGRPPLDEHLTDTDPVSAVPVFSPSLAIMRDRSRWDGPRAFVRRFMERYRDDERLLAIEVMNEPGWRPWKTQFAAAMFETMLYESGRVPLTVGSTSLANNARYADWGADVLQFHYNHPPSRTAYRDFLNQWRPIERTFDGPVWLTEWQRVRPDGGSLADASGVVHPKYASLAPLIREAGVGNFFWSLMVRPAYIRRLRLEGVINGLFHEDGAVWSREDARAIKSMSGDASFETPPEQRRKWPTWATAVQRHVEAESDGL